MVRDTYSEQICRFAFTRAQAEALVAAANQADVERLHDSRAAHAAQELKIKLEASKSKGLGPVGVALPLEDAMAFVFAIEHVWMTGEDFDDARAYWALEVKATQRKAKEALFKHSLQQLRAA
jgi:hypothetical protein|tara:strand:+ start:451 stop:816 length:366 start_codon:yes stop_codon:yes gene_type:complete